MHGNQLAISETGKHSNKEEYFRRKQKGLPKTDKDDNGEMFHAYCVLYNWDHLILSFHNEVN